MSKTGLRVNTLGALRALVAQAGDLPDDTPVNLEIDDDYNANDSYMYDITGIVRHNVAIPDPQPDRPWVPERRPRTQDGRQNLAPDPL